MVFCLVIPCINCVPCDISWMTRAVASMSWGSEAICAGLSWLGWLKLRYAWSVLGSLLIRYPGMAAEAEVGINQEVLGYTVQQVLWKLKWVQTRVFWYSVHKVSCWGN